MTPEEIAAIKAKPESERTPEEKQALLAAERKPGDVPPTWEEIFNHPRFKELNKRAQDAEAESARLKKEQDDAKAKALQEQGKWQEIAETRQKEIDELKSKSDKLDSYETTLQDTLKAQLAEIPEALRPLVPSELSVQQQLGWIAKNKATLQKPKAFDIKVFEKGLENNKPTELTADELQAAAAYGMKPEEYAAYQKGTPDPNVKKEKVDA
jgi:hypothetical protein